MIDEIPSENINKCNFEDPLSMDETSFKEKDLTRQEIKSHSL